MLSDAIKTKIDKAASDPQLQLSCVRAMFHECERGTDLWEALENDAAKFSPETRILLWGSDKLMDENGDEEDP